MSFYAVANGRNRGIFTTWKECSESVKGFKNSSYKKFSSKLEAEDYILNYNNESKKIFKNDFIPDYFVYTDGACANNGYLEASAGIGIFFKLDDPKNVSKKISGKQTNNTAELTAIIETFYIIENDLNEGKKIVIVSDSEYAISCATDYGKKCSNKNWDIDIPNKLLVKQIYNIYKNYKNIKFLHVKAHTNKTDCHSVGNDQADKLANKALNLDKCPYTKIFFDIPYNRKDEFKKMGGLWDSVKKRWYISNSNKNIEKIIEIFGDLKDNN